MNKAHQLAIALFSIFLLSCTSFDKSKLDNLNGDVQVIGHAGSGFYSWLPFNPYPSNSLISIQKALDEGAQGIEVDLHMTSDKKFVLYHDGKLDSKTNQTGCLSDYTLEELKEIDYQLGFPFDLFHSEKLIGLEDLILELNKRGGDYDLHLDLRHHSECHDDEWDKMWEKIMLKMLKKELRRLKVDPKRVTLITYSKSMARNIKRKNLRYNLSYEVVGDPENEIKWALKRKIDIITIKPKYLTSELSKKLHNEGVRVITFGARSKSGNKNLLLLNPDVIQTNNVSALVDLLSED